MGKASRDKGKRGERMWRDVLKAHGLDARRGAQYSGNNESPDVVCSSMPGFHCEVKFVEQTAFHNWIAQAVEDSGGKGIPYVAWKKSSKDWLVVLRAEDFIKLVKSSEKVPTISDKIGDDDH